MKQIVIFIIAFMPILGMAQKIKVDGDKVSVDGKEYALVEKEGCGMFDAICIFTFKTHCCS
jgi:hypothetical protein